MQLIDAARFCHPLRKKLGDKKNEITPKDREAVTKLYTDFRQCECCKIFDNEDFLYREYTVMPPLQRFYELTSEKLEEIGGGGAFSQLFKKQPEIEEALESHIDDGEEFQSRKEFEAHLRNILRDTRADGKTILKLAKAFSTPDRAAKIERDGKGEIIYDEELKDTEIVPFKESVEDYMAREVLPHMPGAKAFFMEDLTKKKPVIKTGAEFPFTRHFYKYEEPEKADDVMREIAALDEEIAAGFKGLKSLVGSR